MRQARDPRGWLLEVPLEDRLTFRVKQNSCWEFTGSLRSGYGRISYRGREISAHRAAAHLWLGFNLDDSRVIMHTCDNPICINPEHLRPGTRVENNLDAVRKGRHAQASKRFCVNGHEFTPENTYWGKTKGRMRRNCRRCSIRRSCEKAAA